MKRTDDTTLAHEHVVLMAAYGRVQQRCTAVLARQAAQIEQLEAQAVRLRAEVVLRDSRLAFMEEDRRVWEQRVPGLPSRRALARTVDALSARVQQLTRERLHQLFRREARHAAAPAQMDGSVTADDAAQLTTRLEAADLVICQVGCLSHGDHWRVQDHCRRTGKPCILAPHPEAVRVVRVSDGTVARVARRSDAVSADGSD